MLLILAPYITFLFNTTQFLEPPEGTALLIYLTPVPKILPRARGPVLGSPPHVGPALPTAARGLNRPVCRGVEAKGAMP